MRRAWRVYGGYALGFLSLFVLWHLAAVYLVGSVLFPPPAVVARKAWALARSGVLWEHLSASLQRILAGFVAGSLLGMPIGLAMGSFRPVRRLLDAAPVEADPAKELALDDRGLEPELRGADRGDIAAGPGAQHHNIVIVSHCFPLPRRLAVFRVRRVRRK